VQTAPRRSIAKTLAGFEAELLVGDEVDGADA
jgi:hypothetical protein